MKSVEFTTYGHVTKDVDLKRIASFLAFEIESMTGKKESKDTKEVMVRVVIEEVENYI
jgi:hypothetical protein